MSNIRGDLGENQVLFHARTPETRKDSEDVFVTKANLLIVGGPILGLVAYLFFPESGAIAKVAGVVVWMAFWWMTEAVKIYFTALLPLMLFPLLGIAPMSDVAPQYTKEIIFLFVGGFLIAFGLERWNLHRRMALRLILLVGATPTSILIGFMLSSYLLSMWISNTATVTMLLPAVLAVISQLDEQQQGDPTRLATPLLLGLAYASSIGGMATIVGTPPNLIFMSFFNERYASPEINFANWFAFGLPLSLLLLGVSMVVLRSIFRGSFRSEHISTDYCRTEYAKLGSFTYEEKVLSVVFGITVLLWFFMKDISFGTFTLPGWTSLPLFSEYSDYIKESTVAMLMAGVLYVVPSRTEKGGLIRWQEVTRLPLGIIFLFGGGFALAEGFETSGLSTWLAEGLSGIGSLPPFFVVLALCLFMTFLTELTSNSASAFLMLPVLYSFMSSVHSDAVLIFIPVVLSASCAFMLPVATPPNTIVFGSERVTIRDMMRAGIWLNLIGAILIASAAFTVLSWVF